MKKGFTLVELAIVLVVIGLLMGMAFKGKSLVDAARIKADVNKIEKMSTAINVYYSKYDTLPGIAGDVTNAGVTYAAKSSGAVYQTLIDEGLLKDGDFKSASGATYWTFTGCSHNAGNAGAAGAATATWDKKAISEQNNLCIYRSSKSHTDFQTATTDNGNIDTPSISGSTICQIETLLDDKNLRSGDGRLATNYNLPGNTVDETNWNCANNTANNIANTGVEYLYRIF